MNFLAHAMLAARRETGDAFVLGSMLPDFATMAGLRVESVDHDELAAGVAFHHDSDDAFHGADIFVELMGEARDELEDAGVDLGPAMAVGHVGVELLLDGWLVETAGGVPNAYVHALRVGPDLADQVHWTASKRSSRPLRDGESARDRWTRMCERLLGAPVPAGYTDPGFVTDRLERILAARPRLALDATSRPLVSAWAHRAQPRVFARAADLFAQVDARMR